MRIYHIALGVMVFTFALNMVNDMSIFKSPLPDQRISTTEAQVTAMVNSSTDSTDIGSEFFEVLMIIKVLKYVIGALSTTMYIVPLLQLYQIPSQIYMPIQGIIWFIYGWGVLSFLSGRSSKNYD